MTFTEELAWRGLINQTTYQDINLLNQGQITFYFGVDPSSDSMQIGNLAAAMLVKCFIKHGHKPVLLVGGATGLIGDPDGKSQERQLIEFEQIAKNKTAIASQYKQLFKTDFTLVDNYDWFKDMGYLDFLRTIGKHVPMRQMLGRDFVESRLGENGAGISYAEFSYVLIQAYDFLNLYKNNDVTLQLCGSDQWGNSVAGVDLIRRVEGAEVNVFSTPLVIDDATGRKFGKSESGTIWLDPNKTSPTQFYQFWININDQTVEKHLKIFTELDEARINEIMAKQVEDLRARYAQTELAKSVTELVHGEEAAATAAKVTEVLTGKTGISELNNEDLLNALRQEIPSIKLGINAEVAEALVASGLASSKTEARKLIAANAISINGAKSTAENLTENDFKDGHLLLRRGKAFKDSVLLEVG
jgi:tyrosyl-tRNA synthetase